MKSFVFWLVTAAALGALAGSTLRLGFLEIVIIWAAVVGLHYGLRGKTTRRHTASPSS